MCILPVLTFQNMSMQEPELLFDICCLGMRSLHIRHAGTITGLSFTLLNYQKPSEEGHVNYLLSSHFDPFSQAQVGGQSSWVIVGVFPQTAWKKKLDRSAF